VHSTFASRSTTNHQPPTTNHRVNNTTRAMTNLDVLLLKGASSDNPEESLRELRYAILTDGIPANSDGMV